MVVPFAELLGRSSFSFLEGASHPEELVFQAVQLGLSGLALTDESGGMAHVTIPDVVQSNGVIHVVDKVLLPK